MIHRTVNCPWCGKPVHIAPFVGRTLAHCPWCDQVMCMMTDGVSPHTTDIRVRRPVNGMWAVGWTTDRPTCAPLADAAAPTVE